MNILTIIIHIIQLINYLFNQINNSFNYFIKDLNIILILIYQFIIYLDCITTIIIYFN